MDDESGWNDILLGMWGPSVRDAVVARVEHATLGARCLLVRTLGDPDTQREAWVEQLHALVVGAIQEETGADLDELGSQAAWASYEEVWDALAARWADGGPLDTVPLRREVDAIAWLQRLSPIGAQAAGMDVGVDPPEPLWIAGRLRIDLEGLDAAQMVGQLEVADRVAIDGLVRLVRG